jgi:hypothetical protein
VPDFDPQMIAARWYLGDLAAEKLPNLACEAIELGHKGKHLSELAGLVKPTKRDVAALVDGSLREMGVAAPMTKDEAAKWMLESVKADARTEGGISRNFVGKLLLAFPELEDRYVTEIKEWHSIGNYWGVSEVLEPILSTRVARRERADDFVRRFSSFAEEICNSGDDAAINTLWLELFLEWVDNPGDLKFLWSSLGRSTRNVIERVALRRGQPLPI